MPLTLEQFTASLLEVGLLSADDLAVVERGLPRPAANVQELATALVRHGKLTKHQAREAFAGKAKSLVLGQYVLLEFLGAGGMGQVFRARQRNMDREVALKTLSVKAVKSPESIKRFQREVRAAARLTHPNIVMAFDADQAGGTHFLVMEFVDGPDLKSILKQQGILPVERAIDYMQQAARGLAYAHEQGVVHRDIKPANLLVDREGTLKILDMGLARLSTVDASGETREEDGLTETGIILGTADFMPPEQTENTRLADERSDVYSLGCTFFYLLAGRPPYMADTTVQKLLAHSTRPTPSVRALRPEVPAGWDTIIQRMMAKEPGDRQQSMQELLRELSRGSKSNAVASREDSSSSISGGDRDLSQFFKGIAPAVATSGSLPIVKRARSRLVPYAIGGAVTMVLLVIVALLFSGRNSGQATVTNTSPTLIDPAVQTSDLNLQAAQRAVELGGAVEIVATGGGVSMTAHQARELPKPPYRVQKLTFPATSALTESDLKLFGQLPALTTLELQGSQVNEGGIAALAASKSLRQLAAPGTAANDRWLDVLQKSSTLLSLDLSRTRISGGALVRLERLPQLQRLFLAGNEGIDDAAIPTFARLPTLGQLSLAGCPISGEGFAEIAAGRLELQLLDLSACPLTEAGLMAVVAAAPKLHTLDLSLTPLVDAWIAHLRPLPYLGAVQVSRTQFSDAGLAELATFPKLTSINIKSTSITAAGIADAITALPKCNLIVEPEKTLPPPDADGWSSLFDGHRLMGCHVVPPALANNWRVVDGVLESRGPPSILYSKAADFTNVHFRCEMQFNPSGNSGMFVRAGSGTHYEAEIIAPELKHASARTGCLWIGGQPPRLNREVPVLSNTWFVQEIAVCENRVQIWVNGELTCDYVDPSRKAVPGSVAIQHFSAETRLQIRRLQVRRITSLPGE